MNFSLEHDTGHPWVVHGKNLKRSPHQVSTPQSPPRRSFASDSLFQRRLNSASQGSRAATSGYRKDEYKFSKYQFLSLFSNKPSFSSSTALENHQLDRKTQNLTSSWRSSPSRWCLKDCS